MTILKRGDEMFKNYLNIVIRNLKKHRGHSLINISGLAVGMACFILILLYVQYEFNFEMFHEKIDRIYQVTEEQKYSDRTFRVTATPAPMAEAMKDDFPEIVNVTRFAAFRKVLVSFENKAFYETRVVFTDAATFDIFSFPFVAGDKNKIYVDPYSVVITETKAKKYFGEKNPIGKSLKIDEKFFVTVTGVIKDLPKNTRFTYDIFISFSPIAELRGDRYLTNWSSNSLYTYLLLPEDYSYKILENKIRMYIRQHTGEQDETMLRLHPLKDKYLYSSTPEGPLGRIKYVYMFLAIGFLIIITACINFMNLSTARSSKRSREIGLRKVVGATRPYLIRQFLGEAVFFSFLSVLFSLIVVFLFLPVFSNLAGKELEFRNLLKPVFILSITGITIFTGLLSGLYPAFFLASFQPAAVLKTGFKPGVKGAVFRKVLVTAQFTISLILIIATFVIVKQINFMKNKDLGYNEDQIVILPLGSEKLQQSSSALKNLLLQNPNISEVSGSLLLPNAIGWSSRFTWEDAQIDESLLISFNRIDYDFIDTYEIQIIEGRNFFREFVSDTAGAVILNEKAVKLIGWEKPIGKWLKYPYGTDKFNVIGVIKDFHVFSLKHEIAPVVFFLRPIEGHQYLSVKINTDDITETLGYIEESWKKINPVYPFEYTFFDTTFESRYRSEERLNQIIGYFSFLAVFISCLGLFGLASFAAEQRLKEIGIRKVLGASVKSVVMLLSTEFVKWVLIANIIAMPVAYFIMNQWLGDFAYRTGISWTVFLTAGLLSVLIALVTVSFQTIKAAYSNPINILKYE